ncbi:hypothetical protein [Streptomyces canus]|uniref:hypothetical protein n=1 Tax=Streptomyces canus TaxID=58343 RepID=UPI0033A0EC10
MAARKPFDRDPDRRISLGRQRNRHDLERRLRPGTTEVLFAYIEYDGDDFEIWHLGDPDTESPS